MLGPPDVHWVKPSPPSPCILPQVPHISSHFLRAGRRLLTIAGFIAQRAGSDPFTVSGLMAAGLVLFGLTLVTNLIASTHRVLEPVRRWRSTSDDGHRRTGAATSLRGRLRPATAAGARVPPAEPSAPHLRAVLVRRASEPDDDATCVVMAAVPPSARSACAGSSSRSSPGRRRRWLLFWVVAYALFLGIYFVVSYDRVGWLGAVDRVITVAVSSAMVVVLIPLVWLVSYIIIKGLPALRPSFFLHDQRGVTPTQPATAGGGLHAIVGTIEQVGLALLWSLPLGAATAFFLNESRSKLRRPVRIFVDAMSGMPSIVSGLFIYATLIIPLAKYNDLFSFNGFMASLALSMTMMPTICRSIEVVLRLVPGRAPGSRDWPSEPRGRRSSGLRRPAHTASTGRGDRRDSRDCPGSG